MGEPYLQLVRGWRHGGRATIIARVVTEPIEEEPARIEGIRERVETFRRRYFRLGVSGALASIELGEAAFRVRADHDGFIEVTVPLPSPEATPLMRVHQGAEATHRREAPLVGPHPRAHYAVVSDVDDTILETELDEPLERATSMLLSDVRARAPFEGQAQLYEHLWAAGRNPFFYLSNSPWNLYEHLDLMLRLHELPEGPILLRRVGSRRDASGHKRRWLDRLLLDLEELPVVLLGDTTRSDGEVYLDVAEGWPGRVKAIFLRDFDGLPVSDDHLRRAKAASVPLVAHRDAYEARSAAERLGLVDG